MLLYIKEDQVIRDTHSSTESLEQWLLLSLVRKQPSPDSTPSISTCTFLNPCRRELNCCRVLGLGASVEGAEDEAGAQIGFHCHLLTVTLCLELVSFTTSNTLSLIPHTELWHLNAAIPSWVSSEATLVKADWSSPGLIEVFCISTQTLVPSYPQEQC